MTHTTACRLPKKPSELILVAIADLTKAEKSPAYEIDMDSWHNGADIEPPLYNPRTCKTTAAALEPCAVCLAGSVIAFSLKAPPTVTVDPETFTGSVRNGLFSLNLFRCGEVSEALDYLGVSTLRIAKVRGAFGEAAVPSSDYGDVAWSVPIIPYSSADSVEFKKQLKGIAKTLASVGL